MKNCSLLIILFIILFSLFHFYFNQDWNIILGLKISLIIISMMELFKLLACEFPSKSHWYL